MTRLILLPMFFFGPITMLIGQPSPCLENAVMGNTCHTSCISCNLDGFEGYLDAEEAGTAPSDFCTFVRHNVRWLSFIAGTENITLEMSVEDCVLGSGLEAAIYSADECGDFQLISNCRGGNNPIRPGTKTEFKTNRPLTIGQHYYVVMDGNFGDQCRWSFAVREGKASLTPMRTSGIIQGLSKTCPGIVNTYYTLAEESALYYRWTLDGRELNGKEEWIDIPFLEEGEYLLCVTAYNACDQAPPTCKTITVSTPKITERRETICSGECFTLGGSLFCSEGQFEVILQTELGCDSTVILHLEEVPNPTTSIDVNICLGDTFFIADEMFLTSGVFQKTLESSYGCDSTVILDLFTVICNIESQSSQMPPSCYRGKDGSIDFTITNGTPPFNYTAQRIGTGIIARGRISELNQSVQLRNLIAGDYTVLVEDNFGNQEIVLEQIESPERLEISFLPTDYNGIQISCYDRQDGNLSGQASGGTEPYNYLWNNGSTSKDLQDLKKGKFVLAVEDNNGCMVLDSFQMNEPDSLSIEGEFLKPDCEKHNTGIIQVKSRFGGTGSMAYSVDNYDFTQKTIFDNLIPGDYLLVGMDANGCMAFDRGQIVLPQIPIVHLDESFDVNLGDTVNFNAEINDIQVADIHWIGQESLSCDTCLNNQSRPLFSSEVKIVVESADGCLGEASSYVNVRKERQFYVPNIFSPNMDGINDHFSIFPGREVETILSFQVYNRWGELVYSDTLQDNKKERSFWDGSFLSDEVPSGSYLWHAEIEFIDGAVIDFQGTTSIIR